MTEVSDEMVAFRLGPRDREAIRKLIDSGEFRNRSDFLRYAVKSALAEMQRGAGGRARLDLDIEGVDLGGSHAAGAQKGRPAPRNRKGVNL